MKTEIKRAAGAWPSALTRKVVISFGQVSAGSQGGQQQDPPGHVYLDGGAHGAAPIDPMQLNKPQSPRFQLDLSTESCLFVSPLMPRKDAKWL